MVAYFLTFSLCRTHEPGPSTIAIAITIMSQSPITVAILITIMSQSPSTIAILITIPSGILIPIRMSRWTTVVSILSCYRSI